MRIITNKRIVIVFGVILLGISIGILLFNKSNIISPVPVLPNNRSSVAMRANIDPNAYYNVTDVVDGDTFRIMIDKSEITVRMLGINTPETVDPRKSPECYGIEASNETKKLLNNNKVKLLLNPNREKTDIYGRILAYVYLPDGMLVNQYLIQNGYAKEYTVGSAYTFQQQFRSVQTIAKNEKRGLWGTCKMNRE